MEPFERNEQESEDDFSAHWETSDPMLLSIVKSFLDAQEIHYFVVGEELFFWKGQPFPPQIIAQFYIWQIGIIRFYWSFWKERTVENRNC